METAKVDIRKLQLLTDRIQQAIDALNQVRLSVHGFQPTTGIGAAQVPFAQIPFGVSPFGVGQGIGGVNPLQLQQLQQLQAIQQMQHALQQLPYTQVPGLGVPTFGLGVSPWAQSAMPYATGVSQIPVEMESLRYAQSFPNVFAQATY